MPAWMPTLQVNMFELRNVRLQAEDEPFAAWVLRGIMPKQAGLLLLQ
jgi:hypothetical protein